MKINIGNLFFIGCGKRPKPRPPRIKWRISQGAFLVEGFMSALFLSSTQQSVLTIQPVDAKGNPAEIDGMPKWAMSNSDVADLSISEDGMSVTLVAVSPGATQVSVSVDARFGPEINLLTGVLDVTVTPAEAVGVTIVAGRPTEQAIPEFSE